MPNRKHNGVPIGEYVGSASLAAAFEDLSNHAQWIHIDHDRGTDRQRVAVLIGPWIFVESCPMAAQALAKIHARWRTQAAAMEGKTDGR